MKLSAGEQHIEFFAGRHPEFTPHMDTGDHVIVVNAERVVLTGKKLQNKMYRRHSGYPGGLKEVNAETKERASGEQQNIALDEICAWATAWVKERRG